MPWDTRSIMDKPFGSGDDALWPTDTGDESSASYCAPSIKSMRSMSTISFETGGGKFGAVSGAPPQRSFENVEEAPPAAFPPRQIDLPVILRNVTRSEEEREKDGIMAHGKRRSLCSIREFLRRRIVEVIGALAIFLGGMVVLIAVLVYLNNTGENISPTTVEPPSPVVVQAPAAAPVTAPVTAPVAAPDTPSAQADNAPVSAPVPPPVAAPVQAPIFTSLSERLIDEGVASQDELQTENSPQSLAYQWLVAVDEYNVDADIYNEDAIQRYSLATLYFATGGRLTSASWFSCSAVPNHGRTKAAENKRCVLEGKELVCADVDEFITCDEGNRWLSAVGECSWYGITCNEEGQVIGIQLSSNGLFGELPAQVGSGLPQLEFLYLQENQLYGELPRQIGQLENLVELNLELNELSSSLPDELWDLKKLEFLLLGNNKFSGEISDKIGQLRNLRWLSLKHNAFSGELPDTLGRLQSLEIVSLEFNDLEGDVPEDVCDAPSLLDVSADCLKPEKKIKCECCTTCCSAKKDECKSR